MKRDNRVTPSLRCRSPNTAYALSIGAFAAVCMLAGIGFAFEQIPTAMDYDVKAGFTYNFAIFTKWPVGAFPKNDSKLVVCVYSADKTGTAFDVLNNKDVAGRTIRVVDCAGTPDCLPKCHLLFVPDGKAADVRMILEKTRGKPVLTVGDSEGFSEMGGIITIAREGKKYCLEINIEEAKRAGVVLSSRILKLKRTKIISSD